MSKCVNKSCERATVQRVTRMAAPDTHVSMSHMWHVSTSHTWMPHVTDTEQKEYLRNIVHEHVFNARLERDLWTRARRASPLYLPRLHICQMRPTFCATLPVFYTKSFISYRKSLTFSGKSPPYLVGNEATSLSTNGPCHTYASDFSQSCRSHVSLCQWVRHAWEKSRSSTGYNTPCTPWRSKK